MCFILRFGRVGRFGRLVVSVGFCICRRDLKIVGKGVGVGEGIKRSFGGLESGWFFWVFRFYFLFFGSVFG